MFFLTREGPRLPVDDRLHAGRLSRRSAMPRSGAMVVVPPVVDAAGRRIVRGDVARQPVSLAAFEGGGARGAQVAR